MPRLEYPEPITQLIAALKALPGVGPKSAERMAIWMLGAGRDHAADIAIAIGGAHGSVGCCDDCGFYLTKGDECSLCSDPKRDRTLLCVVEHPTDILPIDRTGAFRGLYHSLGGKLSPLDNVAPEDLKIAPLVARVREGDIAEVILALGSDVEGEATANYLGSLLETIETTKVTRLAQGMPAGGGLENADELTLLRALSGRRSLG